MQNNFTASIVLYNTDLETIQKAIQSILSNAKPQYLYLMDNSPSNQLKKLESISNCIKYVSNPLNPGFGAAHNTAISLAIKAGSQYHFVINPDTYFTEDVISPMIAHMEKDKEIGMMMPRILNPDGSSQFLPKLLPTPFSVLWRKIKFPTKAYLKFIDKYELRFVHTDEVYNTPIISGCFTLLRLKVVEEIGAYDDKFFMYFEDWDLSRRMHQKYKTIYFPRVSVYHEYYSGANKSFKLFKVYLRSAKYFFAKWGWLVDKGRRNINQKALAQFNK